MVFLTVLIVALFVAKWGSESPLHRDGWFYEFCNRLDQQDWLETMPGVKLVIALVLPALVVEIALTVLSAVVVWFELIISVPVLLYSLGRGRLKKPVNEYLAAVKARDWQKAMSAYVELNHPDSVDDDLIDQNDWTKLNCLMLRSAGYRSFERIFVVIFWFLLLGPAGALIYRLTALYVNRHETIAAMNDGDSVVISNPVNDIESTRQALHLRWVLEWPAVRVLGLSLAMTGNFVNCIGPWKDSLWDLSLSTQSVIESYLRGTLGLPSERCDTDVITALEFKAILDLFNRTLIFWMCLLAIITLVFNY